jgi:hypothetical protein
MPNTSVRAAAEGMPDVNRRRLLLGLASASAVAATVSIPQAADAAPIENPVLIRMADELPAIEAECHAADAAIDSVLAQWRPLWPLAPEEIVYRDKHVGEKERGLWGPI